MKTTNVKTKAFETPAPLTVRNQAEKTLQKTVSPRLRRPKVKIHQPEPVAQIESDDEPDIEHMPPRGEPLPDYPSDTESESHWGPNKTFPQFEGEHFTRGYADVYFNTEETRKEHEEKLQKEVIEQAALMDKQAEQDMEDTEARLRVELGLPAVRKVEKSNEETEKRDTTKPTFSKSAKRDAPSTSSTLTSRSAAAALAAPTKAPLARSAAPTATQPPPAQHKGIVGRKARDVSVGKQSNNSQENVRAEASNAKHAAASAATRSTLGYSKGRAASSTLRKPLGALSSNGNTKAKQNSDATPTSQGATKKERHETDEFDRLAAISSLGTSEVDDDLGINGGVASMGVYAEEDELFQLNFGG